jgi:hypothetical protein
MKVPVDHMCAYLPDLDPEMIAFLKRKFVNHDTTPLQPSSALITSPRVKRRYIAQLYRIALHDNREISDRKKRIASAIGVVIEKFLTTFGLTQKEMESFSELSPRFDAVRRKMKKLQHLPLKTSPTYFLLNHGIKNNKISVQIQVELYDKIIETIEKREPMSWPLISSWASDLAKQHGIHNQTFNQKWVTRYVTTFELPSLCTTMNKRSVIVPATEFNWDPPQQRQLDKVKLLRLIKKVIIIGCIMCPH